MADGLKDELKIFYLLFSIGLRENYSLLISFFPNFGKPSYLQNIYLLPIPPTLEYIFFLMNFNTEITII